MRGRLRIVIVVLLVAGLLSDSDFGPARVTDFNGSGEFRVGPEVAPGRWEVTASQYDNTLSGPTAAPSGPCHLVVSRSGHPTRTVTIANGGTIVLTSGETVRPAEEDCYYDLPEPGQQRGWRWLH